MSSFAGNNKIKKKSTMAKSNNNIKSLTRKVSNMNFNSTPKLKIKIPDNNFLENNNSNRFIPINKNSSSKDTMSPPSERNTPRSKSPAADRLRALASRSSSPIFASITRTPGSTLGKYTKHPNEKPNKFANYLPSFQDNGLSNMEKEFENKFYPKDLLDITKLKKGGRKSRKRIRHKYNKRSRKIKKKRTRKVKKKRSKKIKLKKRRTKKRKLKKKRTKKIKLKKRTRKRSKYGGTKVFEMVPIGQTKQNINTNHEKTLAKKISQANNDKLYNMIKTEYNGNLQRILNEINQLPNEIREKWYIFVSSNGVVSVKKMFEELQRLYLNQKALKLEIQHKDINVLRNYLKRGLIPSTKKIILNELDRRSGKHHLESAKMSLEDSTGKQIREKDWFEKHGYHKIPENKYITKKGLYSDVDMSHSRNKLNHAEQEAFIRSMMQDLQM